MRRWTRSPAAKCSSPPARARSNCKAMLPARRSSRSPASRAPWRNFSSAARPTRRPARKTSAMHAGSTWVWRRLTRARRLTVQGGSGWSCSTGGELRRLPLRGEGLDGIFRRDLCDGVIGAANAGEAVPAALDGLVEALVVRGAEEVAVRLDRHLAVALEADGRRHLGGERLREQCHQFGPPERRGHITERVNECHPAGGNARMYADRTFGARNVISRAWLIGVAAVSVAHPTIAAGEEAGALLLAGRAAEAADAARKC